MQKEMMDVVAVGVPVILASVLSSFLLINACQMCWRCCTRPQFETEVPRGGYTRKPTSAASQAWT